MLENKNNNEAIKTLKSGLKLVIKAYEMLGLDQTQREAYKDLKKNLQQLGG